MSEPEPCDEELIDAVLGGDQSAYTALVARYQGSVFRFLFWLCPDRDEVEDLLQEVFIRAYFALPTHRRDRPLAPWLLAIARNLCLSSGRRRRPRVSNDEAETRLAAVRDQGLAPDDTVARAEQQAIIWQAVDALPSAFREIVLLRHLSELSYEEICQATGLPMGTVKSRLNRGRRMLRCVLAAEREPPT